MTEAQRNQKAIDRIEGLKIMQELQKDLGNTGRADIMQSTIDKLTLINLTKDKMINIFTHIDKDFTKAQLQNAYFYLKEDMDVEVYNIQEMICHALLMSYGNVDGAISYIVDWVYESHQKNREVSPNKIDR